MLERVLAEERWAIVASRFNDVGPNCVAVEDGPCRLVILPREGNVSKPDKFVLDIQHSFLAKVPTELGEARCCLHDRVNKDRDVTAEEKDIHAHI